MAPKHGIFAMNEVEKLLEIRKWIEIAKELRASCQNLDVFDARIAEQRARYRSSFLDITDAIRNEPHR
jgi:hypothetical protein